jgi:competence protein ComEC
MLLPLVVACFLALWNPLSLVYDIGLQLSFLSVLCIVAWGKSLTRFFAFLGSFFSEAMALTVAATIGTIPITLYYFGTFSLVGPVANLLAAPAIPVLMYGGIGTLIASLVSAPLATWMGYIPWIATTYLYDIIHIFGSPTWSIVRFDLGAYRIHVIFVALAVLFLFLIRSQG